MGGELHTASGNEEAEEVRVELLVAGRIAFMGFVEFVITGRLLRVALDSVRHDESPAVEFHVAALGVSHCVGVLLNDGKDIHLKPRQAGIPAIESTLAYPADNDAYAGSPTLFLHIHCAPEAFGMHSGPEEDMVVGSDNDLARNVVNT